MSLKKQVPAKHYPSLYGKKKIRAVDSRSKATGLVWLFVLSLILFLSSCGGEENWIAFRGNQGKGYSSERISPPVGLKWKIRLQEEGSSGNRETFAFNNPVISGDTIYFGSTDGNFYALDIESGYMRWIFKTEAAINSVPYADEQNVYFGSNDGKVYAVSKDKGEEIWSFDTGRTVQSTVVRYKNSVICTSDGGQVFFISPEGELQFTLPNPVWHYDTFQVFDDIMYFAPGPEDNPHSMGAFDLNLRQYIWILDTYSLNAIWYSFPALYKDLVLMSTGADRQDELEFNYYAFDRLSGALVWKRREYSEWGTEKPENMRRYFYDQLTLLDYLAPAVWQDLVIYTSNDALVRAFDAETGKLAWERSFDVSTSSSPTVAGDRLYFGLQGNSLYNLSNGERVGETLPLSASEAIPPRLVCLSARTGKLLWEIETEGALMSAPVIADNRIVFGTDRDYFYVLEELAGFI